MEKRAYIPIIGIIIGTLLMIYDNMYYSLEIYMISVLIIILMIIFSNLSLVTKNILQSLTLFPILQIINLSVSQFFTIDSLRYVLIYAIMFMPIYSTVKNQRMSFKVLETNVETPGVHLPIIILVGTVIITILQQAIITLGIYDIPVEAVYVGEKFATIFLIVSLLISICISDTKYWNKCNSDAIDTCSDPMLVVFIITVISNVLTII